MSEARSVSADVEVPVDPTTAFTAFTQELDLWWVRGPINYFDAARAIAMVCEPGVGGRLIEVYDAATGEGLELGRITVWEPGARLSWTSSVDDVEIDVRFVPVASGTQVRVEATIPAGGTDQGGTAWVRVVGKWFGAWCARRNNAPGQQPDLARLAVGVYYAKPAAAAQWLADAFGFESPDPLPQGPDPLPDTGHGHPWIEFRVGNCSLFIFKLDGDLPDGSPATHEPWVYVDDLDDHLARATAGGATILTPIRQTGFRAYTAQDLEGHRWTFAQARPTMR
jgi:uncharacterized glyoxalase superfamily protein PhnB